MKQIRKNFFIGLIINRKVRIERGRRCKKLGLAA